MTNPKTSIENAMDPDKIDTLEKARALTLLKWDSIKELNSKLWDEVDARCGFCHFRDHNLAGKTVDCEKCPVREKCDEIQKRGSDIEHELIGMIDDVLCYVREFGEI